MTKGAKKPAASGNTDSTLTSRGRHTEQPFRYTLAQLPLLTEFQLQQSQSPSTRKALGQVFTPQALVDFILDGAGFTASTDQLTDMTLLEPSCGDGAFLVRAANRIADALEVERLSKKAMADRFARILQTKLWGIDIDPSAVKAARTALSSTYNLRTGRALGAEFFAKNIVVGDFLLDEKLLSLLPPVQEGRVDLIVGNPPYVSTHELSSRHKATLRKRFSTATGRVDLYGLFIEQSISLLKTGGKLAFVVPDKFLLSQTARPLRKLLVEAGSVLSLARFDSHKVFEKAATVPCVFVFARGPHSADFRAIECEYRNGTVPAHVAVTREETLPASRLQGDVWRTKDSTLEAIAEDIVAGHPRLSSLSSRISAGLATGRDSVYVVDSQTSKQLEPELLRPAVRGRDLGAYSIADPHLSIVLPFRYTRGGPQLVDIKDYPRTRAYLQNFRGELEARHCVRTWGKAWFDIHDPVWADVAKLSKVLVPDLAEAPRFVFDDGQRCPLHSAYYIVPKGIDGEFLAAVLNSRPIEFLIRLRAPVVKDGFNRYRRQFLVDLPVPLAPKDVSERIVKAARRLDLSVVNEEVAKLFGLTDGQNRAIEEHLNRSSGSVVNERRERKTA